MMLYGKIKRLIYPAIDLLKFIRFEINVNPATWNNHQTILQDAINQSDLPQVKTGDSILTNTGLALRSASLLEFKDKFKGSSNLRILIHVPSKDISPGGYSVFMNIADSLKYIGIETALLLWNDQINDLLESFKPTIFLSSNNQAYLDRINWEAVALFRKTNKLKIGLTASVDDFQNQDPSIRLNWLKSNDISFFYGFRSPEYFKERMDYKVIFNAGFDIFSLEFGANPLLYYPVPKIEKDLDYVFLASSNIDKRKRYLEWLPKIFKQYSGFIDGPGWHKNNGWAPQKAHKFIYARAKVGINLHIDASIDWASELNERTYILAACGVPQLVDNAKLLPLRFSSEAVFLASSPEEYSDMFDYMLKNPQEAEKRALVALKEVYGRHTTFHRAESLVQYLTQNHLDI